MGHLVPLDPGGGREWGQTVGGQRGSMRLLTGPRLAPEGSLRSWPPSLMLPTGDSC